MINDFINKSLETRPVYLGPEMEPEFAAGHQKVPEGLLLRIVPSGKVVQYKDIELFFRSSTRSNIWSEQVRTVYARMITFSAYFMKNQGEKERALAKLDKALAIKPGFQPALMLKRELIGP
jgi:hypothetical protein